MADIAQSTTRITISVAAEQMAELELFQAREKVASRAEALRLLLEIALETVSQKGQRFWDRNPNDPSPPCSSDGVTGRG